MSAERKKLILAIAVIFAANIFIIALVQYASADLYKRGSSGDTVREIQTRLKNWGYYSGAVDGVYGSGTEEAVRLFQRKNGLSVDGQVAVGAVILNRIKHPSFPNTLSGVIYQTDAFTCMVDGQFDQPISETSYRAAQDALNGVDPSGGAIYYFNPDTATSAWIWSRPLIVQIGKHRFCA